MDMYTRIIPFWQRSTRSLRRMLIRRDNVSFSTWCCQSDMVFHLLNKIKKQRKENQCVDAE